MFAGAEGQDAALPCGAQGRRQGSERRRPRAIAAGRRPGIDIDRLRRSVRGPAVRGTKVGLARRVHQRSIFARRTAELRRDTTLNVGVDSGGAGGPRAGARSELRKIRGHRARRREQRRQARAGEDADRLASFGDPTAPVDLAALVGPGQEHLGQLPVCDVSIQQSPGGRIGAEFGAVGRQPRRQSSMARPHPHERRSSRRQPQAREGSRIAAGVEGSITAKCARLEALASQEVDAEEVPRPRFDQQQRLGAVIDRQGQGARWGAGHQAQQDGAPPHLKSLARNQRSRRVTTAPRFASSGTPFGHLRSAARMPRRQD